MRGCEQIPWLYDLLCALMERCGFVIEAEGRRAKGDMRRFSARPVQMP